MCAIFIEKYILSICRFITPIGQAVIIIIRTLNTSFWEKGCTGAPRTSINYRDLALLEGQNESQRRHSVFIICNNS